MAKAHTATQFSDDALSARNFQVTYCIPCRTSFRRQPNRALSGHNACYEHLSRGARRLYDLEHSAVEVTAPNANIIKPVATVGNRPAITAANALNRFGRAFPAFVLGAPADYTAPALDEVGIVVANQYWFSMDVLKSVGQNGTLHEARCLVAFIGLYVAGASLDEIAAYLERSHSNVADNVNRVFKDKDMFLHSVNIISAKGWFVKPSTLGLQTTNSTPSNV